MCGCGTPNYMIDANTIPNSFDHIFLQLSFLEMPHLRIQTKGGIITKSPIDAELLISVFKSNLLRFKLPRT
jgi:hypothetical protein